MAVCGIVGNAAAAVQDVYRQVSSPFKKYCHEPQIGNTNLAADSVSLSQSFKAQLGSGGPVGEMLSKVGQALQAGDLTAAQKSFNSVYQVGPSAVPKGSHVPPAATKLADGMAALGEALSFGELSAAQQAYTVVQQVWQQGVGAGVGRTLGTSSGVSVHI
jgi:hypothetical protein